MTLENKAYDQNPNTIKEPGNSLCISVIVPVYNAVDCLERCVSSICKQTFTDLEIILVDDGSMDGSAGLCDELAKKDSRIRVFHQVNAGSSAARNHGIDEARGEYLGFVDSDDELLPDMYEKLYRAAAEDKASRKDTLPPVYQIGRQEIASNGDRLPDICIPPTAPETISSEVFFRELLLHKGDCSFCTKLIARNTIGNNRFPVGELNEDFRLFLDLLPKMSGIRALPDYGYLVHYREESNSRTKDPNAFPRVFTDIVNNADYAEKLVADSYPELQKVAVRFGAFQRLDYLLHIPIPRMTKDNSFYLGVVFWVRAHLGAILGSPYLTFKNKIYLLLLGIAPKFVRSVHRALKGGAIK